MIEELDLAVLRDHAEPRELLETVVKYKLTPSDAVIVLT